jgi:hypothetical protein
MNGMSLYYQRGAAQNLPDRALNGIGIRFYISRLYLQSRFGGMVWHSRTKRPTQGTNPSLRTQPESSRSGPVALPSETAPLKNRWKLAKSLPLLAVAARLAAVRNWRFFIVMGGLIQNIERCSPTGRHVLEKRKERRRIQSRKELC